MATKTVEPESKIVTPGSSNWPKVHVLAHSNEAFNAFKATQLGASAYIKHIQTVAEFRNSIVDKMTTVVVVGPFWMLPEWDRYLALIRTKSQVCPSTAIHWFPF